MQNVEDILEKSLINNIKYIYNKNIDTQAMLIFFLRYCIINNTENFSNDKLIKFLYKELNLPSILYYKNIKISYGIYEENSIYNIMDCFIYRYLNIHYNDPIRGRITGKELIHTYYKKYVDDVQRKFKGKKSKILYYEYISKYYMLIQLYNDFNLSMQTVKRFENYTYPINHNDFELSFDEMYSRYYNEYYKYEEKVIEKDLEDFIFVNGLDDIKITARQIKVKSGIIDLMGIDSNNNKVLLELKVVNRPKDLIWQLKSYTEDLSNIYNNIRTIVVAPKLDETILKQIPIEYEVYEFIKNKKKYTFKKIKREH